MCSPLSCKSIRILDVPLLQYVTMIFSKPVACLGTTMLCFYIPSDPRLERKGCSNNIFELIYTPRHLTRWTWDICCYELCHHIFLNRMLRTCNMIHIRLACGHSLPARYIFLNRLLTHWDRVTHTCVNKLTIIGSDNGLSPGRRQAIIWTNDGLLFICPRVTNFNEILIEIHIFSLKTPFEIRYGKWWPFCLGLNVLRTCNTIHIRLAVMISLTQDIHVTKTES